MVLFSSSSWLASLTACLSSWSNPVCWLLKSRIQSEDSEWKSKDHKRFHNKDDVTFARNDDVTSISSISKYNPTTNVTAEPTVKTTQQQNHTWDLQQT